MGIICIHNEKYTAVMSLWFALAGSCAHVVIFTLSWSESKFYSDCELGHLPNHQHLKTLVYKCTHYSAKRIIPCAIDQDGDTLTTVGVFDSNALVFIADDDGLMLDCMRMLNGWPNKMSYTRNQRIEFVSRG